MSLNTDTEVLSPAKLAHLVLQTNEYDQMTRFWTTFLGGKVVYSDKDASFISYDEEHHRIAILNMPGIGGKDHQSSGLAHIGFTFNSLKDLCKAYKQRKALGIEPGWCVNHGPTTSMYYRDPDGNQIETQVDNVEPAEATAMMKSPAFAHNILGVDYDPEELCAAIDRGENEAELKVYSDKGPRDPVEYAQILENIKAAPVGA